jgi:predicted GNAT superfamily acetyltransferase
MLNIGRLGAICRAYLRNVYGEMSDELNRGLPTDRFEVEWWNGSLPLLIPMRESLRERSSRKPDPPSANEITMTPKGLPAPGTWQLIDGPGAAVTVPGNFQQLKACDLKLARDWRSHTRAIFEAYFAAGFVVVDFVRREPGGAGVYRLARPDHAAPGT